MDVAVTSDSTGEAARAAINDNQEWRVMPLLLPMSGVDKYIRLCRTHKLDTPRAGRRCHCYVSVASSASAVLMKRLNQPFAAASSCGEPASVTLYIDFDHPQMPYGDGRGVQIQGALSLPEGAPGTIRAGKLIGPVGVANLFDVPVGELTVHNP